MEFMKAVVILLFALSSSFAHAEIVSKWYSSKVKWIYPEANGNFIILFESSDPECTHADKYYRVSVGQSSVTSEAAEKFYSLALTAAMTGRQLSVNFNTASTNCYINRMYVNFLK